MKRALGRPDPYAKLRPRVHYEPNWALTEKRTVHTSHVHQRSPPRFGTTATGSTNAFWLSNSGVATLEHSAAHGNGIAPAIIRPAISPVSRPGWQR